MFHGECRLSRGEAAEHRDALKKRMEAVTKQLKEAEWRVDFMRRVCALEKFVLVLLYLRQERGLLSVGVVVSSLQLTKGSGLDVNLSLCKPSALIVTSLAWGDVHAAKEVLLQVSHYSFPPTCWHLCSGLKSLSLFLWNVVVLKWQYNLQEEDVPETLRIECFGEILRKSTERWGEAQAEVSSYHVPLYSVQYSSSVSSLHPFLVIFFFGAGARFVDAEARKRGF